MTFLLNPATDKWLANNTLRPLHKAVPVPNCIDDTSQYRIAMKAITHSFHPKLNNIPVWSYGDYSPGLVIEAKVDKPTRVTWLNNLTDTNLNSVLAMGSRQGMEEDHMLTIPHNQVHMHGARVPWTSDGHPDHVFHPNEGRIYYYPNKQAATTMWYHDHTMDVTRLNVYAGLFGLYLLRHKDEHRLLPSGSQEIMLVLQDKSFSDDGKRLYYEQGLDDAGDPVPEFVGDHPVVNGQIWPTTKLQPRIYRLRFCNGANTRFFNLSLTQDSNRVPIKLYVIGTDGGFLPAPVPVESLLLSPGERVDVLIDLCDRKNQTLILRNDAAIPYSDSDDPADKLRADNRCAELLQIKLGSVVGDGDHDQDDDDSRFDPTNILLPAYQDPLAVAPPPVRDKFAAIEAAIAAVPIGVLEQDLTAVGIDFKLRRFKLEEYQILMTTPPNLVSPTVLVNGKSSKDADTVFTSKNALEVWEFVNVTPDTHPMHIHLVQFQVMSRTKLDVQPNPVRVSSILPEPMDAVAYQGQAEVKTWEQGWKDTVQCHPGQSTRVIMKFDGYSGHYVYHCHILEHEDMGMMYPIHVE
jgi:spore coat protein A, manganese oxidase